MQENRIAQRDMHRSFFDRCQYAIDNGFCLEALFMEYAAIEARLEVILGMLGCPCSNHLSDEDRRKVQISHRIECLIKQQYSEVFSRTRLPKNYYSSLKKWVTKRNEYIHGLYKSEIKYQIRIKELKETAEKGLKLSKLLYNEASRIRRLYNKGNAIDSFCINCCAKECQLNQNKK